MTVEELTQVPDTAVMVHEPHGFVDLVECNATDLMVVNAARVSFAKRSAWELGEGGERLMRDLLAAIEEMPELELASRFFAEHGRLCDDDEKVLRFLLKKKHGTPFEHTFFTFHVRAPIFVFREWHRHRIGISINEESARYSPLRDDFYLPDDEHVRVQRGKPGAYTFEPCGAEMVPMDVDIKWGEKWSYGNVTRDALERAYEQAYKTYEYLMRIGIAKEIARACLPVGIYSQQYWTCNARSLMNFLALRNEKHALAEIRDYAQVMEGMLAAAMPVTWAAFVENGRVAP